MPSFCIPDTWKVDPAAHRHSTAGPSMPSFLQLCKKFSLIPTEETLDQNTPFLLGCQSDFSAAWPAS